MTVKLWKASVPPRFETPDVIPAQETSSSKIRQSLPGLNGILWSIVPAEIHSRLELLETFELPLYPASKGRNVSLVSSVRQSVSFVDRMDRASDALIVKCNVSYWLLGQRYRRFEMQVAAEGNGSYDRSKAQKVFGALLKDPHLLNFERLKPNGKLFGKDLNAVEKSCRFDTGLCSACRPTCQCF